MVARRNVGRRADPLAALTRFDLDTSESLKAVRRHNFVRDLKIIALDDDPTGSQSVSGVPLVTSWSPSDLRWLIGEPTTIGFVLTNSRSLGVEEAKSISRTVALRAIEVASEMGKELILLSRGDSTLRGHVPDEPEALTEVMEDNGVAIHGVLFVPSFVEAGRITVDDIQWVRYGPGYVPVATTEYSRDEIFGFRNSNLRRWLWEKTGGAVSPEQVVSVGLDDIRVGGAEQVKRVLRDAKMGSYIIANTACHADLDVLAEGVCLAEAEGHKFVYRTGPSFIRARIGAAPTLPLGAREVYNGSKRPGTGLVIAGSHTDLTTAQLDRARSEYGLGMVSLDLVAALDERRRSEEIDRVVTELNKLRTRGDTILCTTRRRLVAGGRHASLAMGHSISSCLVEVIRRLDIDAVPLRYLVAKGGITSHEVATRGLGITRAHVNGQMLPGQVSVWMASDGHVLGGMPFVVFPGNVGDDNALVRVLKPLRETP